MLGLFVASTKSALKTGGGGGGGGCRELLGNTRSVSGVIYPWTVIR